MHLLRRWVFFVCWALMALGVGAEPVTIGSTAIDMPTPAGHLAVNPQMDKLWAFMGAAQGNNRILALYISAQDAQKLLDAEDADLDRNIVAATSRRIERLTVTPDSFAEIKTEVSKLIASQRLDALQSKELDRISTNVGQTFDLPNPQITQSDNQSLAPHVDRADRWAYSSSSSMQYTLPNGQGDRYRTTSTMMLLLIKGKVLNLQATGGADDLGWTRRTVDAWADAIVTANPS